MKEALFLSTHIVSVGLAKFVLLIAAAYDLIVIEDEATPLAAGAGHANYYIVSICVMLGAAVIALIIGWFVKRKNAVKRLIELNEKRGVSEKAAFTIRGIRDQITEAENEICASMM